MSRILLHICCAPCANQCIESLRAEGQQVTGFWYNPNIHPFTEYRSRRNTLREYAGQIQMELLEEDVYGLRPFVQAVAQDIDHRCTYCYQVRMDETARIAAQEGYDGFTTSLLISPYQNHEGIIEAARAASERYQVPFVYRDFRPLFRKGQERARELGFYMQKYCGCIFSEEDRYCKKKKKVKKDGEHA